MIIFYNKNGLRAKKLTDLAINQQITKTKPKNKIQIKQHNTHNWQNTTTQATGYQTCGKKKIPNPRFTIKKNPKSP